MDTKYINKKLEDFKQRIVKSRIAVIGLGISNLPLTVYLARLGCNITVFDEQPADRLGPGLEKLSEFDIGYHLGKDYLEHLKNFGVIFKTPRLRHDSPELLDEAIRGAWVTSEMEVFVDLCPCMTCGITGSSGKTTTATIIDTLLRRQGYSCWLGGNIGVPLLEKIDSVTPDDRVVLELSSFQLQAMRNSPDVAVITNITPNHLDVHKSYEEYIHAKKNIFIQHGSNGRLILNYDNPVLRSFEDGYPGRITWFSRLEKPIPGVYADNGMIMYCDGVKEQCVISTDEIRLPGLHNLENYLAAIAAVIDSVDTAAVSDTAASLTGVEHRLELFAEHNGVRYYNDSKATSPVQTAAALRSFDDKVILIAGGRDKHLDYQPIGDIIHENVKLLILTGETSDIIENSYRQALNVINDELTNNGCMPYKSIPIIKCVDYSAAVTTAMDAATQGDVILFSPASTSFDMFRNFEERGRTFKEVVRQLIEDPDGNKK